MKISKEKEEIYVTKQMWQFGDHEPEPCGGKRLVSHTCNEIHSSRLNKPCQLFPVWHSEATFQPLQDLHALCFKIIVSIWIF